MSSPLFWPTEKLFEPIGPTAANCLTRNLPPDVPASILALNVADCRDVLFSVFCEGSACELTVVLDMHRLSHLMNSAVSRKLDFTCSDYDPGTIGMS